MSAVGVHSELIKMGSYHVPEEVSIRGIPGLFGETKAILFNIDNKMFRDSDNGIHILDGNGIKQLRLTKVEQLIQEYVNDSEWHTAIRIAVQKFNKHELSDQNAATLQNTIRIISVKYIDYFLQTVKVRPGQTPSKPVNLTSNDLDLLGSFSVSDSFLLSPTTDTKPSENVHSPSSSSTVSIRLRLIFQMLILSNNIDFLFDTVKNTIQPRIFWRAIGDVVMRYGGFKMDAKYLSEEMITLPEEVMEVLVMNCVRKDTQPAPNREVVTPKTNFGKKEAPVQTQGSSLGFSVFEMLGNLLTLNPVTPAETPQTVTEEPNSILEAQEENFIRLVHALKRKGYWTCVFKLGIQFPETKVMSLFLTILLSNAFTAVSQKTDQTQTLMCRERILSIIESSKQAKLLFESDPTLTVVLRLFYFLRQVVHLRNTCSAPTKERVWTTLVEWMLNKHNLVTVSYINLNLHLEVLHELFLMPEIMQSQRMLKHIHRVIKMSYGGHSVAVQLSAQPQKPERVLSPQELKDYGKQVVKELLDYLYNVMAHELSQSSTYPHLQDVGFFYAKVTRMRLFQDLLADAPVSVSFLRCALSNKFVSDRFYDKYTVISKDDFELTLSDLYEGVYRMKPKLVSNPVKQDLVEQALAKELYVMQLTQVQGCFQDQGDLHRKHRRDTRGNTNLLQTRAATRGPGLLVQPDQQVSGGKRGR